jgi:uncharacterized protein (DUF608 family)
MPRSYTETEHQELFVPDADLGAPIHLHVPSALGPLRYFVCLRLPDEQANRLDGATMRLRVGGLRPDDISAAAGEGAPEPDRYPSREAGLTWRLFCEARVSRGDAELTFQNLPEGLARADVLLCTWPRFLATGQADEWLACQADPAWAPGGVPLGGIGAGKVEVSRDGRFRNYSGNNNQDMPFEEPDGLDGAFLSVAAGGEERLLATRETAGLRPCPTLEAELAFPQVRLLARDVHDRLDAEVTLAGPTVPHDPALASLPGCILRWRLSNRSDAAVDATCRFAWPNLVGSGGGIEEPESRTGYADGFYRYWEAPDQQKAAAVDGSGFRALRYANAPSGVCPAADGYHFVAVRDAEGVAIDEDPRRGSVRRRISVPAGGEAVVEMALVWEMPHWIDSLGEDRGLYWQTHRPDGPAILRTLFERFDEILAGGAALRALLAESDLPAWLQRRLCNCNYPLVTNSVFYRDGRFSINEGPSEMAGCYGTIDQRLGAHPATQLLFPTLNRTELELFGAVQAANGGINHDLGGGHLEAEAQDRAWPDLTCSFILQHARHAWSTGEEDFEATAWSRARKALQRHAEWAEAGSGVAQVGSGLGTSYDGYHYFGTTPYMATLWLATLAVMRRWARRRGEEGLLPDLERWEAAARDRLDADLWTGSYYRAYGSPEGERNENCHAGMLAGEPYARLLAGVDVLPEERLAPCCTALATLVGSEDFAVPPDEVTPDGECAVEYGWLPYVESFGLAALAAAGDERFWPVWERVVGAMDGGGAHPCDTRLMYQPSNGAPSWGAYYMTAPASWLVYDAWLGFWYEPQAGLLRLAPPRSGRYPVVHPLFWGMAAHDAASGETSLEIRRVWAPEAPAVQRLQVPCGRGAVSVAGAARERAPGTDRYDLVELDPMTLAEGTTLAWTVSPPA